MLNSDKTEPLLVVEQLQKHFPLKKKWREKHPPLLKAVDGVSLTIYRGETLGIVGESGSGKSTLAKLILRLLEPTGGKVYFQGKNLHTQTASEQRQSSKHLQAVFQDPYSSLNPRMRAKDLVTEPLLIHENLTNQERAERAVELLEEVGLGTHHLNRYPHQFSGGQRQRLSIARALALKPDLIICDEPVSALDVSIQAQILNLLKKLQQDYGMAYLFIAHGLPAVKHISDRVAIMYAGRIVELADQDTLFSNPKHPYTQGLLQAVPPSHPRDRKKHVLVKGEPPSMLQQKGGCSFYTRCPYGQPMCLEKTPDLIEDGTRHYHACFYPNDSNTQYEEETL
ncbi:ABC transporter ATP-binding protein [Alkalicoccobacillus murimartini]|uniref:Oligopeptide/dipeptide ABC transporter ATP-binding protein n=1 Tax=Alkalicoccobacillus murimartini TaxID=171685 RepID=A0ABT9YMQ5_9BACI|nr:ABC transporter ATP-binding protein [Alkalicoccobacillus murimartini]MDQ0209166.1 oligopeptide/dipeptide ABC transporter ATP-binding protein [Alkalicoccobacillus murimartini]